MKVQCEKCQAEYNIDESRIPPEGLQIKCPRCMATFVVAKDEVPETAGDLFDLDVDVEDMSAAPDEDGLPDLSVGQVGGSSLPPIGGGSSLPPIGGGSSLPSVGGGPAGAGGPGAPAPTPGSEGQIFDFIDSEIGIEKDGAAGGAGAKYRIKRKSGKIFGPFDSATVTKMLHEHQLMGNEEASTDGHQFKPLGAFDEFASVIRSLMEAPMGVSSAPPPRVEVAPVAPRGVEFADAPVRGKTGGSGSRVGLFLSLGLLILLVLGGVAMEFVTDHGFFGHKLWLGGKGAGAGKGGNGDGAAVVASMARANYFQDTYAGYSEVRRELEEKLKNDDLSTDDVYLLGLTYAALLRNYGANAIFVERGRQLVERLKEDDPESPETKKLEAAFMILSDSAKAFQILMPLLKSDTRDKEALFLAGWALAYQQKWREAAEMFDRASVIDPDYAKTYHALGELQSLQRDFDNAAAFYAKALEKNPRHVNSAVELASILIEVKSEHEEGEEVLKQAFDKHGENLAAMEKAKAHYLRALIHQRKHENDKVVQDFRSAIQLAPTRVSFQAALGSFYLDMGEYLKAESLFKEALKQDPKNIDARVGMGRAVWMNGDIVKAKIELENTAKAASGDPRPIYYLGQISEDLDKPEEAMEYYGKAIKISPTYLLARVATARLFLKQGNLKQALVELTEANNFNPRSAIVRNGLGEVYLKQDNFRLAESEFREALRLDSELASAHFNLAMTLRGQEKYPDAIKSFERVRVISPKFSGLDLEHAVTLHRMKLYKEALQMCEDAIRSNPKDDSLYVQAGLSAKAAGELDTAKRYFQTATGLSATNARAFFELALVVQEQKAHEQALDLFKQAVALEQNNPEIHYRMGLSYMETDMLVDAMDEFRLAIKLDGKHIDAMLHLGRLLAARLEFPEAISLYERVVREDPKRIEVWLALGDAYTAQSLNKKALAAYLKAYNKSKRFPGAAYRVGRAQDALGNRKQAVHFYTEAIRTEPSDPLPHYYLAFVYKALYKNEKALAEFKAYLQLRPDAPDADEVRDEIYYLEQDR